MVLTAPLIDGVDGEGDEARVGVVRVPFWTQVNPNQTAVPASPRQPTRDHSRAGRPVDRWGLRVVPGFLSMPGVAICRLSAVYTGFE